MYQIYSLSEKFPVKAEIILVEDSNSGFEFFDDICKQRGKTCISAEGKSNIKKKLQVIKDKEICVIADGAAIGSEMRDLYKMAFQNRNINLYMPESFEWLILKSGVVTNNEIRNILEHTEEYVDSNQYFSWEQYFTKLLIEKTKNTYLSYRKAKLNENYLNDKIKGTILKSIRGINFEE